MAAAAVEGASDEPPTDDRKYYLAKIAATAISEVIVPAVKVAVTRAATAEAHALMYLLASGAVFGADVPVVLRAHDRKERHPLLKGRLLEMKGCGCATLREAEVTESMRVAVKDTDVVFLLARKERFCNNREETVAVRRQNYLLFKFYALALREHGSESTRVVCVGPRACVLGALCALLAEPRVPEHHVTCVARLEEAQARGLVSLRVRPTVPAAGIQNALEWGHPPASCVADLRYAFAPAGNVPGIVADIHWLRKTCAQPVLECKNERPLKLEGSWALAAARHTADWWRGTEPGQMVSMIVPSDGSYEVPPHMFFAFPVTVTPDHEWHIVEDLALDSFMVSHVQKAVRAQTRQLRHALTTLLRARCTPPPAKPPSTLPSTASSAAGTESSLLHSEDNVPDWFTVADVCSSTGVVAVGSGYRFGYQYHKLGEDETTSAQPMVPTPSEEQILYTSQVPSEEHIPPEGQMSPYGYGDIPLEEQLPYGEVPSEEQIPGEVPSEEQILHGQVPSEGQMPFEQVPSEGQMPFDQVPSEGQMPFDQVPSEGQMPFDQVPSEGQMPFDQVPSEGQMPFDQVPSEGQMPFDQVPSEGQMPFDQVPSEGQMPYGQVPSEGQMPYEQGPSEGQVPYEGEIPPGQPVQTSQEA